MGAPTGSISAPTLAPSGAGGPVHPSAVAAAQQSGPSQTNPLPITSGGPNSQSGGQR